MTTRTHAIKCWTEFFEPLWLGIKTFEFRKDDRGYLVGDLLLISEIDPKADLETGRAIIAQVTHLVGVKDLVKLFPIFSSFSLDFCIMSLKILEKKDKGR